MYIIQKKNIQKRTWIKCNYTTEKKIQYTLELSNIATFDMS